MRGNDARVATLSILLYLPVISARCGCLRHRGHLKVRYVHARSTSRAITVPSMKIYARETSRPDAATARIRPCAVLGCADHCKMLQSYQKRCIPLILDATRPGLCQSCPDVAPLQDPRLTHEHSVPLAGGWTWARTALGRRGQRSRCHLGRGSQRPLRGSTRKAHASFKFSG
jgi:hypothetical protein